MIQIDKYDLDKLFQYEKELTALFENIVLQYVEMWRDLNPSAKFEWLDNKEVVADFVNDKIVKNKIIFNGETPHVWFNSQGRGSMLYWSTKDSKAIPRVDDLIIK